MIFAAAVLLVVPSCRKVTVSLDEATVESVRETGSEIVDFLGGRTRVEFDDGFLRENRAFFKDTTLLMGRWDVLRREIPSEVSSDGSLLVLEGSVRLRGYRRSGGILYVKRKARFVCRRLPSPPGELRIQYRDSGKRCERSFFYSITPTIGDDGGKILLLKVTGGGRSRADDCRRFLCGTYARRMADGEIAAFEATGRPYRDLSGRTLQAGDSVKMFRHMF